MQADDGKMPPHNGNGSGGEDQRLRVAAVLQERFRRRNFVAFWLLGFLNNYYYCVVLSAAESIAVSYHLKHLVALISWAEIVGGTFVRLLNAFTFNHIGYNWRVFFVILQVVIGVAFVCVAPVCGTNDGFRFFLSLIGIAFIGNASSYGESAMLGYLDRLPPMTLGGWSSGTGLSGVAASLVYLGLESIPGMSNTWIFIMNLPTMGVYALSFYFLVKLIRPAELDVAMAEASATAGNSGSSPQQPVGMSTSDLYGGEAPPPGHQLPGGGAVSQLEATAVECYRSSVNWRDAAQWGKLTCKAAPDFVEQEAATKPLVVAWDGVGADARPLLASASATATVPAEASGGSGNAADDDVPTPQSRSCGNRILGFFMPGTPVAAFKFTHKVIFANCLNLMLVYISEYAIQFLAPFAFPAHDSVGCRHVPIDDQPTTTTTAPPSSYEQMYGAVNTTTAAPTACVGGFEYDWGTQHAFVLSQFCYQVGVLFSRSSLSVVRIRRVWILTLLQAINLVCWVIQAKTMVLSSDTSRERQTVCTVILLLWMVFVGLMGGASYVNVFFNILNDDDPSKATASTMGGGEHSPIQDEGVDGGGDEGEEVRPVVDEDGNPLPKFNFKELAMNIGAIYATMGITLGSFLDVIISNTLL